jgi:hypothetical protein
MMFLRRVQVAGRSSSAALTQVLQISTQPCGKKITARASGDPAGGRRLAACLGRWRALPLRGPQTPPNDLMTTFSRYRPAFLNFSLIRNLETLEKQDATQHAARSPKQITKIFVLSWGTNFAEYPCSVTTFVIYS